MFRRSMGHLIQSEFKVMITSSTDPERSSPVGTVELYLSLAEIAGRMGERARQARFLFLAVREAHQTGFSEVADVCRIRLLEQNPDHPIGRFPSVGEALADPEITTYGRELAEIYPPNKAEHLLAKYQASGLPKSVTSPNEGDSVPLPEGEIPLTARVITAPTRKRHRKKKHHRKEVAVNPPRDSEQSVTPPANGTLDPLPFEWPQKSHSIGWQPSPTLLLIAGLVAGFIVGVMASPFLRQAIEQIGRVSAR